VAWSWKNCHTAEADVECANRGWKLQNLSHRSWKLYCRTFDKDAHDGADVYHSQSDSGVSENANLRHVLVWIQSIHAEADVLMTFVAPTDSWWSRRWSNHDLMWFEEVRDAPDGCHGVMWLYCKSFMILMFIMASCDSKSFMTMLTCIMALCDSHLHSAWRLMWKAGSSDFTPCFVERNWNL
jgi:hypothetical protein